MITDMPAMAWLVDNPHQMSRKSVEVRFPATFSSQQATL